MQPVESHGTAILDMTEAQNQVGTVWYMPPEHIKAALLQDRSEFDGKVRYTRY
jgi:serine/threonine protein kinase